MSAAARARRRLVDALRASGRIHDPRIAEALLEVPRHLFLPGSTIPAAYADDAVAVQHVNGVATSSASQPSMVAIMLEQLDLRPGHRVLEIGAGTGWNAGLMARIVGPQGSVVSVDIDPDLVRTAREHLDAAGVGGVELVVGDGALGHPPAAPYDRIVLTVGSADVRPEWVEQMVAGGRLLLPLDLRGSQVSVALDREADGVLRSRSLRSCGFIRLRGAAAPADAAVALPGGARLELPGDAEPVDAVAVAAAREQPGRPRRSPVALGGADLWDGFGLWLTLTERGAARLLTGQAITEVHLVLVGPGGFAAVTPAAPRTAVVPHGPEGDALAGRMLAALQAWDAAGRPVAAQWRLAVHPRDRADSPGPARVLLPHARVECRWPGGVVRT